MAMESSSASYVRQAILNVLKARGMSRRQLADQLGWGRMRTQYLLNGTTRMAVEDLHAIAAALGVSVSSLLARDEETAA
jgi:transcriptional regulator with XRE-family HTH domain